MLSPLFTLIYPRQMCGRYTVTDPEDAMRQLFELAAPDQAVARYNMTPSQLALSVHRNDAGDLVPAFLQWGLVPSWAKDPEIGNRMINARSETVAEKPSFRAAYRRRRCLVPADGYYEWQSTGGRKQPWRIVRADRAPFAFAGLWEEWQGPDGSGLSTFCLLTTAANDVLSAIHHRMPVIIAAGDMAAWTDPAALPDPQWLLPAAAPELTAYKVSSRVNSPANDDLQCIEEFEDEAVEVAAAKPVPPAQGDLFGA
jgi:putative SOS response-associated peptidase YedK